MDSAVDTPLTFSSMDGRTTSTTSRVFALRGLAKMSARSRLLLGMIGNLLARSHRRQVTNRTVTRLLILGLLLAAFDIVCLVGVGLSVLNFHSAMRSIIIGDLICGGIYLYILFSHFRAQQRLRAH
jgi:hypothetical protein